MASGTRTLWSWGSIQFEPTLVSPEFSLGWRGLGPLFDTDQKDDISLQMTHPRVPDTRNAWKFTWGAARQRQQSPFVCREQRHYFKCPRASATPRASTLPSSAVAALLSVRIARINPPTCSFSEARVSTLEKPEGPVDQKLYVIR